MKLAVLAMLPLLVAVPIDGLVADTTAAAQKPPATTPAPPRPPKPPATAPRRGTGGGTDGDDVHVTDPAGAPLVDVRVNVLGGLDREGSTGTRRHDQFDGLRAGTYRVRFTHRRFTPLEREIEMRAGTAAPAPAVTLNRRRGAAATAARRPRWSRPSRPRLPPPGKPKTCRCPTSSRRTSSRAASRRRNAGRLQRRGAGVLWQIREPWTDRQHERPTACSTSSAAKAAQAWTGATFTRRGRHFRRRAARHDLRPVAQRPQPADRARAVGAPCMAYASVRRRSPDSHLDRNLISFIDAR